MSKKQADESGETLTIWNTCWIAISSLVHINIWNSFPVPANTKTRKWVAKHCNTCHEVPSDIFLKSIYFHLWYQIHKCWGLLVLKSNHRLLCSLFSEIIFCRVSSDTIDLYTYWHNQSLKTTHNKRTWSKYASPCVIQWTRSRPFEWESPDGCPKFTTVILC